MEARKIIKSQKQLSVGDRSRDSNFLWLVSIFTTERWSITIYYPWEAWNGTFIIWDKTDLCYGLFLPKNQFVRWLKNIENGTRCAGCRVPGVSPEMLSMLSISWQVSDFSGRVMTGYFCLNPSRVYLWHSRLRIDSNKSANDVSDMGFWEMSLLFSLLADPGPLCVDFLFIMIRESEPSLFLEQEAVSPRASVYPDTSKTGQLSRLSRQIRGSHRIFWPVRSSASRWDNRQFPHLTLPSSQPQKPTRDQAWLFELIRGSCIFRSCKGQFFGAKVPGKSCSTGTWISPMGLFITNKQERLLWWCEFKIGHLKLA